MTVLATTIGATGLYLLFAWLLSAAIGSWVTDRKGYGERVGLTFGLLLTVLGLAITLILPARPGSTWKIDGPLPRRRRSGPVVAGPAVASADAAGPAAPPTASDAGPAAPDAEAPKTEPDSGSEPPAA
jgi:hypothetical protein